MRKKTLIQLVLFSLILIFLFSFFYTYLNKDEQIVEKINTNQLIKKDIIQDIQYLSEDANGNTYIVKAKSGIIDDQNQDLILLENVRAEITFDISKKIYISAKKAIYNNDNFDTKFSKNVKLTHDYHNLECNNIDLIFSENYAKLFGDVIYMNKFTKLNADKIDIDLISRKTKISMYDTNNKVKIKHKENGIN